MIDLSGRAFAVARALAVCASMTAAMAFAQSAEARPGTPSNVRLQFCDGYPDVYSPRQFLTGPQICVSFTNTAAEPVRFEYEFTRNGAAFDARSHIIAECMDGNNVLHCDEAALAHFWGSSNGRYARGRGAAHSFLLRHLEDATAYCMRVRTRDDTDTVSEQWSAWACLTTSPPPPAPVAPQVSVQASPSGDRVTVRWSSQTPVGNGVLGYYDVEARTSIGDIGVALVPSDVRRAIEDRRFTEHQFTLDVPWGAGTQMQGEAYYYRVCAVNVAGRTCSDWASSLGEQTPRRERLEQGLRPPRSVFGPN
jgi:hypothetical protein